MIHDNIETLSKSEIIRGYCGELTIAPRGGMSELEVIFFPQYARQHPALQHLQPYWRAWQLVNSCPQFPMWHAETTADGIFVAVNRGLYGWSTDNALALVQISYMEIDQHNRVEERIQYFVTDGEKAVLVTENDLIEQATFDSAPNVLLQAIRNLLPQEWQQHI